MATSNNMRNHGEYGARIVKRTLPYMSLGQIVYRGNGKQALASAQASHAGEYGIMIEYSIEVNILGFDYSFWGYRMGTLNLTTRPKNVYPLIRRAVANWYEGGKWETAYRYRVDGFTVVLQSLKAVQPEEIARQWVLIGGFEL